MDKRRYNLIEMSKVRNANSENAKPNWQNVEKNFNYAKLRVGKVL